MTAHGFVVDTISLTIDVDGTGVTPPYEVNCDIQGVVWNTGDTSVTWRTACPDGYGAGDVKGEQSLDVSFVVDYKTADTLSRLLDVHNGAVATVKWQPDPDGAPDYFLGGEVRLKRGTQTHNVGAVATQSANWPAIGAGIAPVTVP